MCPPPPPEEVIYVERPVLIFDDPGFRILSLRRRLRCFSLPAAAGLLRRFGSATAGGL